MQNTSRRMNKKASSIALFFLILAGIVVGGAVLGGGYKLGVATGMWGVDTKDVKLSDDDIAGLPNLGKAATLSLNAFTGSWGDQGARTEVYPVYTIMNQNNVTVVNDAIANTTTATVVGDKQDIFCTGAVYYCDPKLGFVVKGERDTVDVNAYTAVATTDLVISVYDTNGDALTADDNSNNTADYAGGNVLAPDLETYYAKLEQTGANLNFHLYGLCTWVLGGEADDFELKETAWKEVLVPKALRDTTITMYDDGNASTAEKGFKHCYAPKDGKAILLKESTDTGRLKFVFDADDSTQPVANGDTYFGASFMDGSYSVDKNGNPAFGFYMDDDTEDPGSVGIDENPDTTWNGLDVAFAVEPQ